MNSDQVIRLLNQLAGPYHRELNQWEVRRWAEELRDADEGLAVAAMKKIHRTEDYFPSIAKFLEELRETRLPLPPAEVVVLFGDGTSMKLDEIQAEQIRESQFWATNPMSENEKNENLKRLREAIAEGFARQKEADETAKAEHRSWADRPRKRRRGSI